MLDSIDPGPRGFTVALIGQVSAVLASIIPGIVFVLGQAEPTVTSGASGWAGAGILGLVLATLFFKIIPEKDKQIQDLINTSNIRDDKKTEVYERNLKAVTEHCEKEMALIATNVEKKVDSVAMMVEGVKTLAASLIETQKHVERTAQINKPN